MWKYDIFLKCSEKMVFIVKTTFPALLEKDDIHPRKDDFGKSSFLSVPMILCTYGDLFMCFHVLLSNKKTGNLIYRGEN